jgi:hypothetical protein
MNNIRQIFKMIGGKVMELNKAVVESRERTAKYVLNGMRDPNNRIVAGIITMAAGIGIVALGGGLYISSLVEVVDS